MFWVKNFDSKKKKIMKLLSPTTTVDCRQSLIVPTSKMAKISVQKMNQNSIDNNNVVAAVDDNNHIEIERKKSKSKSSEIIEVNFCYTALISMCLGFLFIWSSVISLIFIVNKIDETRFMQKPLDIFIEQEQIGRVMFSVGQEMCKFFVCFFVVFMFFNQKFFSNQPQYSLLIH